MTRQEIKDAIVERVTANQGMKATQLAAEADLAIEANPFMDDIPEMYEELVREGRLLEIEYVLPNLPFRTKSFYLPAGTTISVRPH